MIGRVNSIAASVANTTSLSRRDNHETSGYDKKSAHDRCPDDGRVGAHKYRVQGESGEDEPG
jgi:hypothetical protein